MFLLGQAQQTHPAAALRQVEWTQGLGLGLGTHLRFAPGLIPLTQVDPLDQGLAHRAIDLEQTVVRLDLEYGGQALVTRQQAGERLLQRGLIQLPVRRTAPGRLRRSGVHLPKYPHALLGIGQPLAVRRLDPGRNGELGKVDALLARVSRNTPRLSCGSSMKRRASSRDFSFIRLLPYE